MLTKRVEHYGLGRGREWQLKVCWGPLEAIGRALYVSIWILVMTGEEGKVGEKKCLQ